MDDREQKRRIDQQTASHQTGVASLRKLLAELEGTNGAVVEAHESAANAAEQQALNPTIVPVEILTANTTAVSLNEPVNQASAMLDPNRRMMGHHPYAEPPMMLNPKRAMKGQLSIDGSYKESSTGKVIVLQREAKRAA